MKLYKSFFKRAIDIAASGCALIVLSLPLTVVTLWLHFANKGAGAFFTQKRPGKGGKIFKPQLWNVLRGDMSLIGPRPLLVQYLPLYSKEQARRHEVRPGITGWAQCHGRNAISWQKKFELDVWYVDHISFLTDCKVILTTIKKVIARDDINSATSATMEVFNGHN